MSRSFAYKQFGNALKQYRKNTGLSQDDLAIMLGVGQQIVSFWERGSLPRIPKIVQLEEITGLSLWSLIAKDAKEDL
jgi:transcriptional regulator with XRE-family HTH domain